MNTKIQGASSHPINLFASMLNTSLKEEKTESFIASVIFNLPGMPEQIIRREDMTEEEVLELKSSVVMMFMAVLADSEGIILQINEGDIYIFSDKEVVIRVIFETEDEYYNSEPDDQFYDE